MSAKTAISPTRAENYPEWYQQVISAADLAETSAVRGFFVLKPYAYAIWELMQAELDQRFKETGHLNAYFPLLIPLSFLEKEAAHVDGFAKECAVVTHHRLKADGKGGLVPDGLLEEPLVIRPTSETIIGESFSKWVKSYRDLPLLINQWANVVRWEMRTRAFLRTSEFLWQEGHTAHATPEEAMEETLRMLEVYRHFAEHCLAIPVIAGEKTVNERFPGAVNTYCIEAMMQDRKALQAGTSHFLGQNFAKASEIRFLNQQTQHEYAWTTSWGVTTRLIGALIMTHSDDNGLVLPPFVAPYQLVIIPIYRQDAEKQTVLDACEVLKSRLTQLRYREKPVRVWIDRRELNGGEKSWDWIKKGVPIRIEIGPRDLAAGSLVAKRRDQDLGQKHILPTDRFVEDCVPWLAEIQAELLVKAQTHQQAHTVTISSLEEFKAFFAAEGGNEDRIQGGFVSAFAIDDPALDAFIKPLKVTARCMPLSDQSERGTCIFTGQPNARKIIFAKAY